MKNDARPSDMFLRHPNTEYFMDQPKIETTVF